MEILNLSFVSFNININIFIVGFYVIQIFSIDFEWSRQHEMFNTLSARGSGQRSSVEIKAFIELNVESIEIDIVKIDNIVESGSAFEFSLCRQPSKRV